MIFPAFRKMNVQDHWRVAYLYEINLRRYNFYYCVNTDQLVVRLWKMTTISFEKGCG